MMLRLPLTLLVGSALTIGMFWVLWTLISQPINVDEMMEATRIEFSRMRRDTAAATKRQERVEREPPPPAPEMPRMSFSSASVGGSVAQLTPNINTASGGSLALAGLLEMREEILAAGGREENLRWIGGTDVQELLGARERVANGGRMLWDDNGILGRPAHATRLAPAATLVCGDFSKAIVGLWGVGLRVEIDPYTVEEFEVRLYGDVALLSGRTRMTGRSDGRLFTSHYRYIDTYVRRDGAWKVVSVQITRIAE